MMRWAIQRVRERRISLLIGVFCVAALITACSHWWVWSYKDLSLYLNLKYHSPVAQALWRGEVRAGDLVERVIAVSRPHRIRAFGPFLQVYYYPNGDSNSDGIHLEATTLIAKDGHLIAAELYGCTFDRQYFNVATPEENALYSQLLQARIVDRSEAAK